jgi:DNA repair protein RadA/Sms
MASVIEGSRAFVLEIQSLVTPTYFNYPRRNVTGYDLNRLHMLIAILDKRYGLNISSYDIYINIAGGFKITETAADLSVCASIISSYKNIIIPSNTLFIGEVSLSGGLAFVSSMDL